MIIWLLGSEPLTSYLESTPPFQLSYLYTLRNMEFNWVISEVLKDVEMNGLKDSVLLF